MSILLLRIRFAAFLMKIQEKKLLGQNAPKKLTLLVKFYLMIDHILHFEARIEKSYEEV